MRPSRVLFPIVVACLLPLVVSWGCLAFAPLGPSTAFRGFAWEFEPPSGTPAPNVATAGPEGVGVCWLASSYAVEPDPSNSDRPRSTRLTGQLANKYTQLAVRAGWPCHAFAAQIAGEPIAAAEADRAPHMAFTRSWRSGIRVAAAPHQAGMMEGADALGLSLPIVPLWRGLAIDLALAFVLVVPLPLALEIRRARRLRRRCCVQCGHRLLDEQDRCPECGAPLVNR